MAKEYSFTAFFEPNELKGYTVTVPVLPGLITEGRTLEEAKDMAHEAIRCYLEGLLKDGEPIPEEAKIVQEKIKVAPRILATR